MTCRPSRPLAPVMRIRAPDICDLGGGGGCTAMATLLSHLLCGGPVAGHGCGGCKEPVGVRRDSFKRSQSLRRSPPNSGLLRDALRIAFGTWPSRTVFLGWGACTRAWCLPRMSLHNLCLFSLFNCAERSHELCATQSQDTRLLNANQVAGLLQPLHLKLRKLQIPFV